MHRQFWKSKTFRIWFIGYTMIVLVALVTSFFYHTNIMRKMETKAYKINRNAIEQAANVIDEKFKMLSNVGDSVYVSSEIKRIKLLALPYNAKTYYELHKRTEVLSNFSIQYELFDSLFVYYSEMNCLMDGQRIFTELNQIKAVINNRINMHMEDFVRLVASPHYNHLVMLEDGTVLFLRTLSTRKNEANPIITLVAVMNTNSLRDVLAQTGKSVGGTAGILSPENYVLGSFNSTSIPAYDVAVQSELLADGTVVIRVPSDVTDMVYLLAVPGDTFMDDVNRTRLWYVGMLSAMLILGFIFSYIMAVRGFRPIHALKQRISTDDHEKDEFALINTRLTELMTEENNMQLEIQQMNDIVHKRVVRLYLTGQLQDLPQNQQNSFRFSGGLFVVVVFTQLIARDKQGQQQPLALGVALNLLLEELCVGQCEYVMSSDKEETVVIFCFPESVGDIDVQLKVQSLCTKMMSHVGVAFPQNTLRAFVGNPQHDIDQIHTSYDNAVRAREYANFVSGLSGPVVLFDSAMYSSDVSWQDYDIIDAERTFIRLMMEGKYTKAGELLNVIISYYECTEGTSLYLMRCRMFGMMNMMVNILHEIAPDIPAGVFEQLSPVETLLMARTPGELKDAVFEIIRQLIHLQESRTTEVKPHVEQIKHYIAVNYFDVNLSVQMIADAYGLSLPYLSRIFKKENGTGLLDYINRYRVEKAKEFMQNEPEETITSISAKVGFNSSQTLIRAFKRYKNKTPGQYKAEIYNQAAADGDDLSGKK
jgi:two-component system response regulator YesN